ncbi:C2 domain protein [Oesophagostomum dentatum]|uniref:C2 domain protein n=1 Tax=Oesophagostomum dentatum TaxID=61180 RepID=A0A0B1T1H6_OESDE|nr:C2 domain protein [Oesophagostomum dentatum]
MTFDGSALIRIDLGSRDRRLMDKLKALRDPLLESTYVVHGVSTESLAETNSRNSSRSQANENRPPSRHKDVPKFPTIPLRERIPSNFSDISDSVFESQPMATHQVAQPQRPLDSHREFRPAIKSDMSSGSRERERPSSRRKCFVQLTVHEARGLPPVQDERNRYVSPNTYVSVLGRDGELRSSICERSRRPLWNWTARFYICEERRNLLIKVFHRDNNGDKPLGFVSIPLPIEEARRVDYEMVDLSGRASANGEVPVLTMSVETSDQGSSRPVSSWSEALSPATRMTSPHVRSTSSCSAHETFHIQEEPITATREELAENLRSFLKF